MDTLNTETAQIGDKVIMVHAMIHEEVYVIGLSPTSNYMGETFVVADVDGNAMPVQSHYLKVTERSDIARARAARLREKFIKRLFSPEYIIVL